jgi:hypothetical protein
MGIAARRRIGSKHVTDEFNHERFRYVVDCTTSDSCVKGGNKLTDQGALGWSCGSIGPKDVGQPVVTTEKPSSNGYGRCD